VQLLERDALRFEPGWHRGSQGSSSRSRSCTR
jgi:hypothetical protein